METTYSLLEGHTRWRISLNNHPTSSASPVDMDQMVISTYSYHTINMNNFPSVRSYTQYTYNIDKGASKTVGVSIYINTPFDYRQNTYSAGGSCLTAINHSIQSLHQPHVFLWYWWLLYWSSFNLHTTGQYFIVEHIVLPALLLVV